MFFDFVLVKPKILFGTITLTINLTPANSNVHICYDIDVKVEKNAGVKEKYRSGRVIVRLQEIYSLNQIEGRGKLRGYCIFLCLSACMSMQ